MAQHSTTAAGTFTIDAGDLKLVAFTAKMRRRNRGATCALAATTATSFISVDCSDARRLRMRDEAMRWGLSRANVTPLDRGHIADLYERVRTLHGLTEVRKTWGVGIKALQAEPRFVLNGGAA